MRIFPKKIDKKQAGDAGMGLVLLVLLLGFFLEDNRFYLAAIPLMVINMTIPKFYLPFAYLWFGLSTLLGMIMSRILLTLVFSIFVVPVGVVRRLMGKDSLKLRLFKKSTGSVMEVRDHEYVAEDLEKPY